LLKKTAKDYNLIAEQFSTTRERFWKELEFLKNYVLAGDKVLDWGCGNGRLLEILKDRRIDYYGVDISEKLIELAKKRYPLKPRPPEHKDKKEIFLPIVRFEVVSPLTLPFPDNFFDKIFCLAVFHHLPSQSLRIEFLKEGKRVLKKDGFLILLVWHLWNKKALPLILKYTFQKLIGKSKLDWGDIFLPWKSPEGKVLVERYLHCFTKRELARLLLKSDFKLKEVRVIKMDKEKNIFFVVQK